MTMYFVQFPKLTDSDGCDIPIMSIRLVKNADTAGEAIKIAASHVLAQMPGVTLSTVTCLEDGDGIFRYEEVDGIVKINVGRMMTFEIPSSAVLEAKLEFLN